MRLDIRGVEEAGERISIEREGDLVPWRAPEHLLEIRVREVESQAGSVLPVAEPELEPEPSRLVGVQRRLQLAAREHCRDRVPALERPVLHEGGGCRQLLHGTPPVETLGGEATPLTYKTGNIPRIFPWLSRVQRWKHRAQRLRPVASSQLSV